MGRNMKIGLMLGGVALLVTVLLMPEKESDPVWTSWSLPLSGKTIVLDPGHGGVDAGASGKDGTEEKTIALAVAKKLQNYLQQAGALVYLTRDADEDLADEGTKGPSRRKSEDIRKRMDIINGKNADLFLSIHLNALASTQWHGAQSFYHPDSDEGRHLAKMIQEEVIRQLENTNREALAIQHMYLLKHAEVPGALVEIGFLSNEQERELLKEESYQTKMAGSIYEGILRYVTEEPDEEEGTE